MRTLVFGALLAALLGLLHAPLGIDLLQLQALEPETVCRWRGLALALAALGVASARTALPHPFPAMRLVLGTLAGWVLTRLVLDPWTTIETRAGLVAAGLGLGAALVAAGRLGRVPPAPPGPAPEPPDSAGSAGLALTGAGTSMGFFALGRWVAHFSTGRPADDAAAGLVLLGAIALGTVCFRDLVRSLGLWSERTRVSSPAALTALAAGATVLGIALLSRIATRESLEPFLRSLGSNPAHQGQWDYDALVAARGFAAPGLFLGVALTSLRHRRELAALLLGAAAGTLALPPLLERLAERALAPAEAGALAAVTGAIVAAAGAALALLARRGRNRRSWILGLLAVAAAVAEAALCPRPEIVPLNPWQLVRPEQELERVTRAGHLSVEWARGFSEVLAVDRRRVTPTTEEEEADRQELLLSLGLLAPETRERGARVLLLGQLTPARDRVLREAGHARVDRAAPWWRSFDEIEAALFHGAAPLDGECLSPRAARERIAGGTYDLVIAPAVRGIAPAVPRPRAAPGTIVAVWLDAAAGAAARDWGDGVLMASDALLDWTLGCVFGPWDPRRGSEPVEGLFEADRADLALLPAGARERSSPALVELGRDAFVRSRAHERACARRLAGAARDPRAQSLTRGLVIWFEAQRHSAFWDQRVASLEIAPEALAAFSEAARSPEPPDAALAYLWERLASALIARREIQLVFDELEPVARAHPFWPALERALARADLEFLDPESAARRLRRLAEIHPLDIDLKLETAHALSMAGDHAAAAEELRAAERLQPDRRDIRRELAMAMVRAGEAGGRALVQELLDLDPSDEELKAFLGPGPYPPVPPSFTLGADHAEGGVPPQSGAPRPSSKSPKSGAGGLPDGH